MIYVISVLSYLLLFFIGLHTGRKLLVNLRRFFDILLIIPLVLLCWTFKNSYLIKIFDYELMLSPSLQAILFGLLIGRLIGNGVQTSKSQNLI